MLTQHVHNLVHRVDLYREVTHAVSQIDMLSSGCGRNELDRDELVLGQLEHREMTEFRFWHGPDDIEAERLVECKGDIEIRDSQSWAQCSHGRFRLPRIVLGYSAPDQLLDDVYKRLVA